MKIAAPMAMAMESNPAIIKDMINKLITMKPYLEGPPNGVLQTLLSKTYNQVNALYLLWLDCRNEEEPPALEDMRDDGWRSKLADWSRWSSVDEYFSFYFPCRGCRSSCGAYL